MLRSRTAASASSYILTGPESLSQAEQVGIIGDVLGRPIVFEELPPDEFRRETPEAARPAVDMLLAAWNAAMGQPAYVAKRSFVVSVCGLPS